MDAITEYILLKENRNDAIPIELKRVAKNGHKFDGPAGIGAILSTSDIRERFRYHSSQNTVDPNFLYIGYLIFKNTPESGKLLPDIAFEEESGLAGGASLNYFYNTRTKKIAQFLIHEREGSGYTKGFKWKPKDVTYVTLNNIISFMEKVCKQGTKKKFW